MEGGHRAGQECAPPAAVSSFPERADPEVRAPGALLPAGPFPCNGAPPAHPQGSPRPPPSPPSPSSLLAVRFSPPLPLFLCLPSRSLSLTRTRAPSKRNSGICQNYFLKAAPGMGGRGGGGGVELTATNCGLGWSSGGPAGRAPAAAQWVCARREREREPKYLGKRGAPGRGGGRRTRAARPPSGNSARGGPPWGPQWGHRLSPGGSVRWHPALPPRAQRGGGAQHRAHLRLSEPPGHVRTPQPRAGVRSAELCARPPTCPRRSPSRGDSRAVRVCLAGGGSVAPLRAAAWHTARLLLFSCFFFFFFFYL